MPNDAQINKQHWSSTTTTIVYHAHAVSPHHHHHQRLLLPTIVTYRPQQQWHAPTLQEHNTNATSPPTIDALTPRHTGKEQQPGATSLLAMWQPDDQRTMSFVVVDHWVSIYPSPPHYFTVRNPGMTIGHNVHGHEHPPPSTSPHAPNHYGTPQHCRNTTSPCE
jgi:hypothetical protein